MLLILKTLPIIISIGILFFASIIPSSYSHGIGYEILPPVMLGENQVALEVTSSQYLDPESIDRQIIFALFYTESGGTVRDVTYHIKATKANEFLFEDTFKSDYGTLIMNFIPSESSSVVIEEKDAGFLGTIAGLPDEIFMRGAPFSSGGLYKFEVDILTAENYSNELEEPIRYDVGLSIPDRTFYDIEDPNFGTQQVSLITYYDQIDNFQYEPQTKSVSFEMPFEWSEDNVNQTSVVHEELIISKTFGDLMVSSMSAHVNDFELPEHVITLDDFSENTRIIHVVINQNELFGLLQQQRQSGTMEFLVKPSGDDLPLSTVTGNGQFRITLDWEPKDVISGSQTTFFFDTTDVFLKNRPVSVSYDLSIVYDGEKIFDQSGISTDSKDEHNVVEFFIPEHVSGPIILQFDNLDGNSLARVGLPVVVNRVDAQQNDISIPDWVRNNAGWWSEGLISDNDFASGLQYLIESGIISV